MVFLRSAIPSSPCMRDKSFVSYMKLEFVGGQGDSGGHLTQDPKYKLLARLVSQRVTPSLSLSRGTVLKAWSLDILTHMFPSLPG